jgi:hypothetical protein
MTLATLWLAAASTVSRILNARVAVHPTISAWTVSR